MGHDVDPRRIADMIDDNPDVHHDNPDVSNQEPVRFNRDIYAMPGVAAAIEQALEDVLDRLVADGIISNAQSHELIEKWPL